VIGDAQWYCANVLKFKMCTRYSYTLETSFCDFPSGLRQFGNREVKLPTNFQRYDVVSSIAWKIPVSCIVCTKSNNAATSKSRLSNICNLNINMLEQVVIRMRSEQNFKRPSWVDRLHQSERTCFRLPR
jgi:hypothetical protein